MVIVYTGSLDSVCPITHLPVDELDLAVSFSTNPRTAYECRALMDWLRVRAIDPMTNQAARREDVCPLDICKDPGRAVDMMRVELIGEFFILIIVLNPH